LAAAAAVVVPVVPEAQLPAEPLVAAPLPEEPELPALAPPVPVVVGLAQLVLAGLPVLAHLVVEPEVPVDLLSRQSFSAAMARSSP
jgi:hypothetical protein